ncbi:MAG: DUF6282 family protein [Ferrovibrio sp.]
MSGDPILTFSKTVETYADVPESVIDDMLRGAVDLHCHSGPSVMPRSLNHLQAILEAQDAGMHAVLFKDHYYSVTPVAKYIEETMPDLRLNLLTGVALNNTVGGLNPYAVDHMLKLGGHIVWMPTFSAANHLRHGHRHVILPTKERMLTPTGLSVVTDRGDLKEEVKPILDLIAEADCVLSAGHLHISEIWPLFDEAKKRGVKRLLVNHPTFVVDANLRDIKELSDMGAYIEHSFCMFINETYNKKFTGAQLKELITAAGVERTILGSDLGQAKNPHPVAGFRAVIRLCLGLGYNEAEIRKMIGSNACRLMGLPEPQLAVPAAAAS